MKNPALRRCGGFQSRPWLTRRSGECAFPVGGEGMALRSCCRPCADGRYCSAHIALMRAPDVQSAADFENEIIQFLEQGR